MQRRYNFFGKTLTNPFVRRNPKRDTEEYSVMKKKQIAKRRARNKIARKSRRINQMRVS